MTAAVLALAILAQPECRIQPDQARTLARVSLAAEREQELPSGLVAATVLGEAWGLDLVSRHRHGCDVGQAQIKVPRCDWTVISMIRPQQINLRISALKLHRSRVKCRRWPHLPACKRCIWGLYNPGSKRWCRRVMDIWRRIKAHVEGHREQPTT